MGTARRAAGWRRWLPLGLAAALLACSQPRAGDPAAPPGSDAGAETPGPSGPADGPTGVPPQAPPDARPDTDAPVTGPADAPPNLPADGPPASRDLAPAGVGAPCTAAAECQSGHCADGVCCSTACSGPCQFCNSQSFVGTCTSAAGSTENLRCSEVSQICSMQSCLSPDQGCGSLPDRFTTSNLSVAQIVTVGRSGRLVAVRLALICRNSDSATLQIRAVSGGVPAGPALSSQDVRAGDPALPRPGNEQPLHVLRTPVPVRAGDQIAIVVAFPEFGHCSVGAAPECYGGGHKATFDTDPPAWHPYPEDVVFRTYVVPQ